MVLRIMPSNEALPKYEGEVEELYRDEHIVVVNKPPFFLSVPGRHPDNFDSVQSRMQQGYPEAMAAHRLDLDTSGIMIVALHKEALKLVQRQFQDREVEKEYVAVVYGLVEEDQGEVTLPLRCDWPNRPRQMVCYEHGKNAHTKFEVISRDKQAQTTRLRLIPITGRSHQLRVHTKEMQHPILGCDLYAHEEALAMSPRLLLHARYLKFKHPISGDVMEIVKEAEF